MPQIGKLIQPKVDTVTLEVEQVDLKVREWLPPFEVKLPPEEGEVCQRGI